MERTQVLTSVNISAVKDFQRCRLRWYYKWILNRVPRAVPRALGFGKVLHIVFEEHFKNPGMNMEEACDLVIKRTLAEADEMHDQYAAAEVRAVVNELMGYVEPLTFFKDKFTFDETLEVEEPFEFYLSNGVLVKGRPDRVVRYQGRIYHVQNRSIAAAKNLGMYTEIMQLDMHELIYAYYLRDKYPDYPYGGTIFNLMRKLKYRGANGKILNEPDKIFSQYIVMLHPAHMEQAYTDLIWITEEMIRTIKDAEHMDVAYTRMPAHSRDLNAGMFGNVKDPYFDVFTGKISLSDDRYFMDREDTYATDVVAVEE
jgi:hypothetical protein